MAKNPANLAIVDNYATHKHPKVQAWLARHPHWIFHSIVDLQAAINRYIQEHNDDPRPFVWTKPADVILTKIARVTVPSE
jgi:hypothetical protein